MLLHASQGRRHHRIRTLTCTLPMAQKPTPPCQVKLLPPLLVFAQSLCEFAVCPIQTGLLEPQKATQIQDQCHCSQEHLMDSPGAQAWARQSCKNQGLGLETVRNQSGILFAWLMQTQGRALFFTPACCMLHTLMLKSEQSGQTVAQ